VPAQAQLVEGGVVGVALEFLVIEVLGQIVHHDHHSFHVSPVV
jgi:hypothetical protein